MTIATTTLLALLLHGAPAAPAVTLTLTQPTGSPTVTLAWDPNTEPSLAGYNLYVGEHSHAYALKIDVGKVTTYTVPIATLFTAARYFFVLTAYDAAGAESGYSNEVAWPGLNAPAIKKIGGP